MPFAGIVNLTAIGAASVHRAAQRFFDGLERPRCDGSGANSTNSTPYGGAKEVRVASFRVISAHRAFELVELKHAKKLFALEPRFPAVLIDAIVVDGNQVMGSECHYLAQASGEIRGTIANLPRISFGVDKVIARRAAQEVHAGEVGIFGFGAAGDVPLILGEDGRLDGEHLYDYLFTTEHGPHGGVLLRDWQFSANYNPEAMVDCASHFDFINGGGCAFAALAFAEYDEWGAVNVSKFGSYAPGAGGFIDIAHNAKRLVFTGTFTGGGAKMKIGEGRCIVEREGKFKKFVKKAQQITYSVREGVEKRNQSTLIVTERAVFSVRETGLTLVEIAPGIDLQRDVLDQMEFSPTILDPLPLMDASLFKE